MYSYIIFNLGTRWLRVVSFTLSPLHPCGNSLWYPLYRRLGGPQSRHGSYIEQKNLLPLPEIELRLLSRPARRARHYTDRATPA
jgi:hypothetical protein